MKFTLEPSYLRKSPYNLVKTIAIQKNLIDANKNPTKNYES